MREYGLIMLNMLEYARILNVSDAVHSIRSLCKLLSSYRERERERERDRETQRHRERHRDRDTERRVQDTVIHLRWIVL